MHALGTTVPRVFVDQIHYRLITNIESLNDNPIPDHVFKSSFSFPTPVANSDSFFEKSDTSFSHLDNSFTEFRDLLAIILKNKSGSTINPYTTHNKNSLPEIDSTNDPPLELPEFESFHFDLYDDQSFPRSLPEPPDGEANYGFEDEQVLHNVTSADFSPVLTGRARVRAYTLPPCSTRSEDSIFDPGIST
ncbi:hypothetical protein Tco_0060740 [Tanacetum coccineum]